MTNEQLLRQLILLQGGDMTAFENIYSELSTPVFAIILRVTQNRQLSEDILQEVFIKLYKAAAAEGSSPFSARNPRAYIFQMAHNMALDALRKEPRHESLDELEQLPAPAAGDTELRLMLEEALSRLSAEERLIITLHINAGLKFREIAAITGSPIGTVLWRYNRALKRLRDTLNGGAA